MIKMWIEAIYPKKNTSIWNKEHEKYPYLLNWYKITRPNQVWATDITYIKLKHWFIYLIAIIDWYSKYIISWELSMSLDTEFCLSALKKALIKWKPDIFNTDQWSQFTSKEFTTILKENWIQISMDWKWRRMDNIFTERLWRTIKYEEVYLNNYETPKEAYHSLSIYIDKYNTKRLHSSLWYKTPIEIHWEDNIKVEYLNKIATIPFMNNYINFNENVNRLKKV